MGIKLSVNSTKPLFQGFICDKAPTIKSIKLGIIALLTLSYSKAFALECKTYSAEEAYAASSAIFIGRPVWFEDQSPTKRIVTFAVKESWKGIETPTVKIIDAGKPPNYELFEDYLVFPQTRNTDGIYDASVCPQSLKLAPQFEIIRELDQIRKPQKRSTGLWPNNVLSNERSPEWVKTKRCLSFAIQEKNTNHNCF